MILFWGSEKFGGIDDDDSDDDDSYFLDHTVILCIQSFATLLACINSPNYYLKMVIKSPVTAISSTLRRVEFANYN